MFEKLVRFAAAKRQAKAFDTLVRSGGSLETTGSGIDAGIVQAGLEAWRDQDATETRAERRERIERAMRAALTLRVKRLQTGLPLLATSGSTAPFIGLFGTVWGIMNSFSSIAQSQDTSLAVVAPGIARGPLRHGDRPHRRDPGGDGLQQAHERSRPGAIRLRRQHRDPRQPPRAGPQERAARRGRRVARRLPSNEHSMAGADATAR